MERNNKTGNDNKLLESLSEEGLKYFKKHGKINPCASIKGVPGSIPFSKEAIRRGTKKNNGVRLII